MTTAPTFNSGLDFLALVLRIEALIAKYRLQRCRQIQDPSRNFVKASDLKPQDLRDMEAFVAIGLVHEIPSFKRGRGFQFVPEHRAAKALLARSMDRLSQSQKVHFHSTAHDYRPDALPSDSKAWRMVMWATFALTVLPRTGQQKMANKVGRSRETVNRALKRNPYIRVVQQWLPLGNVKEGHHDLKRLKAQTKGLVELPFLRIAHDGTLLRPLPNLYKRKKSAGIVLRKQTYFWSNRYLNKKFFLGPDNASVPLAKRIAMRRRLSKNSRLEKAAHGDRGKKMSGRVLSAKDLSARCFKEQENHFRAVILPGKFEKSGSMDPGERQSHRQRMRAETRGSLSDEAIGDFATDGIVPKGMTSKSHGTSKYISFNQQGRVSLLEKAGTRVICERLPHLLVGEAEGLKKLGILVFDFDGSTGLLDQGQPVRQGTFRQVTSRSWAQKRRASQPVLSRSRIHRLTNRPAGLPYGNDEEVYLLRQRLRFSKDLRWSQEFHWGKERSSEVTLRPVVEQYTAKGLLSLQEAVEEGESNAGYA